MQPINQSARAFQAWTVLTEVARRRTTITYGDLGEAIRVHHRAIRYVLGPIQSYCLEAGLPPLTILVVNKLGQLGTGFTAVDTDHHDHGRESVWSCDWLSEENPFEFASIGDSIETLLRDLVNAPEDSEEITRLVKTRGIKQLLFKAALVKVYSGTCAFTGFSIGGGLEACHIVAWENANSQQKMDVRNGILLNALHHKLFDRGHITITKSYQIIYDDPKSKSRVHNKFESKCTTALHGKLMRIPQDFKHRPLPENIDEHHSLIGWNL